MLSAFICSSSCRISLFSTAVPNHLHRTMGRSWAGGFLNCCLRSNGEDAENTVIGYSSDAAMRARSAARIENSGIVFLVDVLKFPVIAPQTLRISPFGGFGRDRVCGKTSFFGRVRLQPVPFKRRSRSATG